MAEPVWLTVLHVVEPHLNGPGGDLTAALRTTDDTGPGARSGYAFVLPPGGVVGVPELIGGGLVDRHLPRASGRVGGGARVDGERVEALRAGGGGRVGHGVPL